jgi:hypothetical protein
LHNESLANRLTEIKTDNFSLAYSRFGGYSFEVSITIPQIGRELRFDYKSFTIDVYDRKIMLDLVCYI